MKPAELTLDQVRGDFEVFTLTLTDGGAPLDLTPYTEITFRAETRFSTTTPVPSTLTEKTLTGGGVVVTDAPGGVLTVTLQPADTSGVVLTREVEVFQWSLRLEDVDSKVQSPVCGPFNLRYCGATP